MRIRSLAWFVAVACGPAERGEPARPIATVTAPSAGAHEVEPVPVPAPLARSSARESCEKDESPESADRVAEAFVRGRTALREGRNAEARQAFREAYRGSCAPNALFAFGITLEKLDDFDGAISVFRDYLATQPAAIGRRRAETYIACVERRRVNRSLDCLAEQLENPVP